MNQQWNKFQPPSTIWGAEAKDDDSFVMNGPAESKAVDDDDNYLDSLDKLIISHANQPVSCPDGHGGDNLKSCVIWQEFNLPEPILKGLAINGYRYPSGIQGKTLFESLRKKNNVMVQSQNGTGKTCTYIVTILTRLDLSDQKCQALVMVSTRELALQVAEVARKVGHYLTGFNVGCAVTGIDISSSEGAQLIVGAPGTLMKWVLDDKIDMRHVQIFVLDEADKLMSQASFFNIAKNLRKRSNKQCQIMFFSATFDDSVREYAQDFVNSEIKEILLTLQELSLENVRQFKMKCKGFAQKLEALHCTFRAEMVTGCLVFCMSRKESHQLSELLIKDGHSVAVLSGLMTPAERDAVIEKFRNAEVRVLIATNVCARGLDIPHVNLVINWNMPLRPTEDNQWEPDHETYLHRVGRAGRFGRFGLAINFCTDQEEKVLGLIEHHFDIVIPFVDFNSRDDMKRIKDPINDNIDY